MNNWWKAGLMGAAGAGLLAASGGTLAGPLGSLLGGAGEGAAAAGTAGAAAAGTAAATDAAAATGGMLAANGAGAAAASPATAFVTQPVTSILGGTGDLAGSLAGTDLGYGTAASNSLLGGSAAPGEMAGSLAGTDMAYGGSQALASAPSADPSAFQNGMQKMMDYGKTAGNGLGKAASAYGTVNKAMTDNQHPMQAPQSRPVYSGSTPSIAQAAGAGGMQPAANQNLLLAQIARRRQMGY